MKKKTDTVGILVAGALAGAWLVAPQAAYARCDTMDGPVVQAAKSALGKKDITPVLKWVKPEGEAEVRSAFTKTLAVRAEGPEAREKEAHDGRNVEAGRAFVAVYVEYVHSVEGLHRAARGAAAAHHAEGEAQGSAGHTYDKPAPHHDH